jgi:hypothetical protein
MCIQAGVGVSHHRNPRVAGQEAATRAITAAGVERPDFVFMFAAVGYDQQALLRAVSEATGQAPLCGCSGEGILAAGEADESNFAVAVMAIRSDQIRFSNGMVTGLKQSSETVGRAIAQAIQPDTMLDPMALFLFPDGMTVNFDRLLANLEGELNLDPPLPLFGGASADNWTMKGTFQYFNDQVVTDGAVWALLSGQAELAWAVSHGCVPIGSQRKVTRSEGNAIYEIDGKPVLEVLGEYLVGDEIGNWEQAVVNVSIGLRAPSHVQAYDEQYEYLITRFMPSSEDVQSGFVTIPTEVSAGTDIWVTRRDHEKIANGLERMAEQIKAQLKGHSAKLVFQFDCAGRGKVVFREQQKLQLLKGLQEKVARDAPWMGFYTYGEIGPVGNHNCFHNYTAVVLAIH